MKSDFKSDALQMLQEGRVLGVAARPTVGIRFPANVQWPYADGRSEAQVRQKGIHQSSRFERLRIGIINTVNAKLLPLGQRTRRRSDFRVMPNWVGLATSTAPCLRACSADIGSLPGPLSFCIVQEPEVQSHKSEVS